MPRPPRLPSLKPLLRTAAPPETLLLRLALAAGLLLDGARQLRLHPHIGRSQLAELFALSRAGLAALGAAELLAAALLLGGLATRPAAAVPLVISLTAASAALARVGTLSTASALTALTHAAALALVSAFILLRGAGPYSIDANLTRRGR